MILNLPMQILHSSGVPVPAAARRATECAAALPASVAAPAELGEKWADDERWLSFRAAMEAAGALATDIAATLPPGLQLKSPAYLRSSTLPLLRASSQSKGRRRQCMSCYLSISLWVMLDPIHGMPAHMACLTAE